MVAQRIDHTNLLILQKKFIYYRYLLQPYLQAHKLTPYMLDIHFIYSVPCKQELIVIFFKERQITILGELAY